jgi:hypothetical protein
MRNIIRARLPGSFYIVIGVGVLLAAVAIYFSFVTHGDWTLPSWNRRPKPIEKAQLKVKVWTDKQSGFYYCPGDHLYGHTSAGRYVSQGEALQEGYVPAMNEPCQQSSPAN